MSYAFHLVELVGGGQASGARADNGSSHAGAGLGKHGLDPALH